MIRVVNYDSFLNKIILWFIDYGMYLYKLTQEMINFNYNKGKWTILNFIFTQSALFFYGLSLQQQQQQPNYD